jgi:ATP-binding cassette subfamily C (CFTR/MRP) protein 4
MNATLEGLTTIRAFKAEAILRDEFDRHQDLYTSTSYCLQTSMKALILILNTFTVLFNATIVLRFLIFDFGKSRRVEWDMFNCLLADTPSGYVGLALSQAYMISMTLNGVIRRWTELENQMTSVERVLEYVDVEKENRQGFELEDWPTKGEIVYENVYLLYPNTNEYVLKNIHFTVKSGEKIGIVGRTGAGKSSIISALFRLYEVEGKISIDDVDTKTLSSDSLRTKISIIPQDPVIFSGTIRDNIDPSRKYTDEEIWKAIQKTNLKKSIWSLDTEIAVGTCNFSVGQKQLLCLARAVIQQNKIVVLDEATANMDPDTEAIIRQTVEENFGSCTVLTVAHRISSIMKSDRIFVLDKGEIIECDKPETLLENKDGAFYKMVEKAKLLEGSTL